MAIMILRGGTERTATLVQALRATQLGQGKDRPIDPARGEVTRRQIERSWPASSCPTCHPTNPAVTPEPIH
jgi:hypothetical protein